MTASELFALACGRKCKGNFQCHWCGAPCTDATIHDDPPPIPFVRSQSTAKYPSNGFICIGCWLFRQQRQCLRFQNGMMADGQALNKHSWWITEKEAIPLRFPDNTFYERLLHPPDKFSLILYNKVPNLLQLALANRIECPTERRHLSQAPLGFTFANIPHYFSPYELQQALDHGSEGKQAGVRVLIEMFGPAPPKEKLPRGRPRKEHFSHPRLPGENTEKID